METVANQILKTKWENRGVDFTEQGELPSGRTREILLVGTGERLECLCTEEGSPLSLRCLGK